MTPRYKSLLLNIIIPLASVLMMNGIVFALHWDQAAADDAVKPGWRNPPGTLIGIVWMLLFILMGIARWQASWFAPLAVLKKRVAFLMVVCVLYPLYTIGLTNNVIAQLSNIAINMLTVSIIVKAWPINRRFSYLLTPVMVWLFYATVITSYAF